MTWREALDSHFGPDLAAIGASFVGEIRDAPGGHYKKDLFFFAVGDRLISIGGPPLGCFISPPGSNDINDFEEWTSIFVAAGDQPADDSDEALFSWLATVPEGYDDVAAQIGTHLRSYFGATS